MDGKQEEILNILVGQLPRVSGKDPERKEWTQLLKRLLANSLVYPERIHRGIEWTSVFETFFVCLSVSKFSLFYTVQYGKVQYSTGTGAAGNVM